MYERLDSLIVSIIKASREANLARISSGDVWVEAKRIAAMTGRDDFRVIDGRLQALKKRGLIIYIGGAWRFLEGQA